MGGAHPALDALALEDPELVERVQIMARASGLVSNAMGLAAHVSGGGVHLDAKEQGGSETLRFAIGTDVREAAIALAVPEASYKVYAETDVGGSMSMPMSMPHVLVAPEPARLIRREELGIETTTRTLIAELKRRFADEGAVRSG